MTSDPDAKAREIADRVALCTCGAPNRHDVIHATWCLREAKGSILSAIYEAVALGHSSPTPEVARASMELAIAAHMERATPEVARGETDTLCKTLDDAVEHQRGGSFSYLFTQARTALLSSQARVAAAEAEVARLRAVVEAVDWLCNKHPGEYPLLEDALAALDTVPPEMEK